MTEQSVTVPELDLEAIRKRCEAATPGPWHFVPENAGLMFDHGYGLLYGEADCWGWEKNLYISVGCSGNVRTDLGQGAAEANAAFIAHARQDIPALLDHIASLSQPQDAPPVRDAELVALVAEARRMGRLQPSYVGTWRKVNEVFDVLLDALSARDRLLAEAKEVLSDLLLLHKNSKQSSNSDTTFVDTRDWEVFCSRATSAYRRLDGGVK